MNSEPVVRVKTESFEHFLDPFLSESRNNSAFADLSNRRINGMYQRERLNALPETD